MFSGGKSWAASRGVWGGLVAVAAGVAGLFGYTVSDGDVAQVNDLIVGLGAAAGGLLAILGRIKASRRIGKDA